MHLNYPPAQMLHDFLIISRSCKIENVYKKFVGQLWKNIIIESI